MVLFDRLGKTLQGRLVRTTGTTFLLRCANVGLNFGIVALVARFLGPDGYGQYSVALALLTTLAIPAQFGLPALVIREVSRARADHALWRFHDISRWAFSLSLSIGLPMLFLALLIPFAPFRIIAPEETPVVLAGSLLVALLPLSALRGGLIRGLDRVALAQVPVQIVQPIAMLVAISALIFAGDFLGVRSLNPVAVMVAYVTAVVVGWLVGGVILFKLQKDIEKRPGERWRVPRWKTALLAFGFSNAMVLIDQQVGLLVLGATSPDLEAGFYKVASQAATFTAMGYIASNMALGPDVAKKWREAKRDDVQIAVVRGSRLSTFFAFPVSLFFLLAGGLFLQVVFGKEYLPAWPAMALLVFAQFVNCAFGSNTTLLNMSGNERANAIAFAIAVAINVALAFALAPRFGATGAAAATAVSVLLRNLFLWRLAHRLCGMETGFWGRIPSKAAED